VGFALQLGVKDTSLIKTQGFIDGKWVDAKDGAQIVVTSQSDSCFVCPSRSPDVRLADPATSEELGRVPEMGLAETKEAIDAAAKAFPTWSRTTAKACPACPPVYRSQLTHSRAASP
jgi:succinate-semialdehyde dehydrogenase/glutarate-semialdehyde dehydrogenase